MSKYLMLRFQGCDMKWVPVDGQPVTFEGFEEFEFFTYFMDGSWRVSIKDTGCFIPCQRGNREAALLAAGQLLRRHGVEEVRRVISVAAEMYGRPPCA